MKNFTGTIIILRAKNNIGKIDLDNGGSSLITSFNPIYETGDRVKVTFLNDDPLNKITSINSVDDLIHYGTIMVVNKNGTIFTTCNYPKQMEDLIIGIPNNGETFKLYDKICFTLIKKEQIIAKNIKIVTEDNPNYIFCNPPIVGKINYKDNNYYFKYTLQIKDKNNPSKKISKKYDVIINSYINLNNINIDFDAIYFGYGFNGYKTDLSKILLRKIDKNKNSDLINCYKSKTSTDEIKFKIIDYLIQRILEKKLQSSNLKVEKLISEKIDIIKRLIALTTDEHKIKKLKIEICKLKYDPNLLTNLGTTNFYITNQILKETKTRHQNNRFKILIAKTNLFTNIKNSYKINLDLSKLQIKKNYKGNYINLNLNKYNINSIYSSKIYNLNL